MRTSHLAGILLALTLISSAQALTLQSPQPGIYNTSTVIFAVAGDTPFDSLRFSVDSATSTLACSNCVGFSATLNLTVGNHTLMANGTRGNASELQYVNLSIIKPHPLPNSTIGNLTNATNQTGNSTNQTGNQSSNQTARPLGLRINSPLSKTYPRDWVSLNLTVETPANLSFDLDGTSFPGCVECRSFSANLSLLNGTHIIRARASDQNRTENATVTFLIKTGSQGAPDRTGNRTKANASYVNKLPQLLEAGAISDAQLAAIIRGTHLPPGIVNRLIKTGKLGPESIDAILAIQKQPKGIWRKLWAFMGAEDDDRYPDLLAKHYNLSDRHSAKLLLDDDLSDHEVKELKKQVQKTTQQAIKIAKEKPNKTLDWGKAIDAGNSGSRRSEHARSIDSDDDSAEDEDSSDDSDRRSDRGRKDEKKNGKGNRGNGKSGKD